MNMVCAYEDTHFGHSLYHHLRNVFLFFSFAETLLLHSYALGKISLCLHRNKNNVLRQRKYQRLMQPKCFVIHTYEVDFRYQKFQW